MKKHTLAVMAVAALGLGSAPTWAQDAHGAAHGAPAATPPAAKAAQEHPAMQGGAAPPDARDPHAYSGGYQLGTGPYALPGGRQLRLADEHRFGSILFDRLEAVRSGGETRGEYDILGWYGRDYSRLWFKAEGEVEDGSLEESRTELLWGRAVAPFWDAQVGVRHDRGEAPSRNWLAFGIQGLAPYWFEVEAAAYVGESGRTALRLEAEYELLLTQRLILQPRVEANLYGKRDEATGVGSGLSALTAGLRLRYEIRRELAPYVGVEWQGLYGGTADLARAAGAARDETRVVAGIRFWF